MYLNVHTINSKYEIVPKDMSSCLASSLAETARPELNALICLIRNFSERLPDECKIGLL